MLKTNKLRFFKILEKASKPLKTLNRVKKKHHDDCNKYLGYYKNKKDAAAAFNEEAIRQYGVSALINHIER